MIYLKLIQFAKNYWKPLYHVVLVLAIIILFMLFKSERIRANEAEQGRDAAIQISNGLSILNHKYRNKQGDSVIVTKAIVIPKSNIDELLKQNDLKWLKKFEGVKTTGSNLLSAESFEVTLETGTIKEKQVSIPCKDSLKAFAYDFHDQWNDIHALVIDTPRIEIRDHYYAALELRRPKHWFLKLKWGKRDPVLEITNSNKLIKIDSVAVIVVK